MKDMEAFYDGITNIVEGSPLEVSPTGRMVALLRVAVEYGAVQIGLPTLAYLMSRILTITLGLATGDEEATYDDILEEFDPTRQEQDKTPDWAEVLDGELSKH